MFTKRQQIEIAKELKFLADKCGNQTMAAEAVGATRFAYSLWINGNRKIHPRYLSAFKKLGCDIKILRPDLDYIL